MNKFLRELDELIEGASEYKRVEDDLQIRHMRLQFLKRRIFPTGSVVFVNNPRYEGFGIIAEQWCGPEAVSVQVESGNRWLYDIKTVVPGATMKVWPTWVRKVKLRRALDDLKRKLHGQPGTQPA